MWRVIVFRSIECKEGVDEQRKKRERYHGEKLERIAFREFHEGAKISQGCSRKSSS